MSQETKSWYQGSYPNTLARITLRMFFTIIICGFLHSQTTYAAEPGPNSPDASGHSIQSDQNDSISYYLNASVYSDYVFRGLTLYDGTSFQPSVGGFYDFGDYGRIGAGVWMHVPLSESEQTTLDLTSVGGDFDQVFSPSVKFFELDPTISYDVTVFDKVNLSFGHTWYTDPDPGHENVLFPIFDDSGNLVDARLFRFLVSRGDTAEFFAGASLDLPLNPEFTFVVDYRRFEYEYYTLGFSQPFHVTEGKNGWVVTPHVTFGFSTGNSTSFDVSSPSTGFYNKNGLEHVDLAVSAQVTVDDITIKPSIHYVFVNDDALGNNDIVWTGFDLSYDGEV